VKAEFWVMHVLVHFDGKRRRQLTLDIAPAPVVAQVNAGAYVLLPDQCIAEPIEVFEEQRKAEEHREQLVAKYPHEDFRVILNTDEVD
jgi:hypothetical protein